MNNPAMTIKGEQAKKQLIAAALAQFGEYGMNATTTGCDANDTRMILHTHALIGEILAFRLGKETILLRTGWTAFDEEKTELINQTVTCHIDLILQGLSQRSL